MTDQVKLPLKLDLFYQSNGNKTYYIKFIQLQANGNKIKKQVKPSAALVIFGRSYAYITKI